MIVNPDLLVIAGEYMSDQSTHRWPTAFHAMEELTRNMNILSESESQMMYFGGFVLVRDIFEDPDNPSDNFSSFELMQQVVDFYTEGDDEYPGYDHLAPSANDDCFGLTLDLEHDLTPESLDSDVED